MSKRNWVQKSGDIEKAYCWDPLPKDQWIAVRMPKAIRKYNDNNQELHSIVKKNLYGGPASGRIWGFYRDCNVLYCFNGGANDRLQHRIDRHQVQISDRVTELVAQGITEGWQCFQTEMDPCLFRFVSPQQTECLIMIHTDDLDGVGERMEDLDFIFDTLNRIWKVKIVDSSYILGVTRTVIRDENNRVASVELTIFGDKWSVSALNRRYSPAATTPDCKHRAESPITESILRACFQTRMLSGTCKVCCRAQ